MKLLLDENLSRRIVPFLQAAFPGSSQVALLGLETATEKRFGVTQKNIILLSSVEVRIFTNAR